MKLPNRLMLGEVYRDPISDACHRLWWDVTAMAFEVHTGPMVLNLDSYLTMFPQHRDEARQLIARALWQGVPTRM